MTATKLIVVPSNPADLKTIGDAVNEACDSLIHIDSEREQIKSIIDDLVEKFPDINAKYFRKLISDRHKASFDKKSAEQSDYETLYESVFG